MFIGYFAVRLITLSEKQKNDWRFNFSLCAPSSPPNQDSLTHGFEKTATTPCIHSDIASFLSFPTLDVLFFCFHL